ncbi:MAG: sulfotransferase domain-containing protein [Thermoplasmatota archaeon]
MVLDKNTNYIVSGLERSGTSMLMQILKAGGIPIAYDNSRPPDEFNPKGYYELEGGKIINKLIKKQFPMEKYKGRFIKITSYGLKFLPKSKYKIIYSERNIDEVLDSMEKMMKKKDENKIDSKKNLIKLNNGIKKMILNQKEIDVLFVNYNNIIKNPKNNIKKILDFLGLPYNKLDEMVKAVDVNLYKPKIIK